MHYKNMFDNWIGFVSGVFGGGVWYNNIRLPAIQMQIQSLQIHWREEWLKVGIAGLTALVCGGMGVIGKYLIVWTWRKIKPFIFKNK